MGAEELRRLNKRARKGDPQARRLYDFELYRAARLREENGLAAAVAKATGVNEPTCIACLRYLFRTTSKDDRRLRSKHLRALSYASSCNVASKRLHKFIRKNGGLNGCARLEAARRRRGMSKRKRSSGR